MASSADLKPQYTYAATIEHWADGDTVDMTVDVGFKTSVRERFRVWGLDTPERGQPKHDEAWYCAKNLAPEGSNVTIQVFKATEKWGRYLAIVQNAHGVDVAQELIKAGLAKPYFGGTKDITGAS